MTATTAPLKLGRRKPFAETVRETIVKAFGFGDDDVIEIRRSRGTDWEAEVVREDGSSILVISEGGRVEKLA